MISRKDFLNGNFKIINKNTEQHPAAAFLAKNKQRAYKTKEMQNKTKKNIINKSKRIQWLERVERDREGCIICDNKIYRSKSESKLRTKRYSTSLTCSPRCSRIYLRICNKLRENIKTQILNEGKIRKGNIIYLFKLERKK